jgi:hypothetical protein
LTLARHCQHQKVFFSHQVLCWSSCHSLYKSKILLNCNSFILIDCTYL